MLPMATRGRPSLSGRGSWDEELRLRPSSCCLVTQLRLTLYDPMDCSRPGLAVPHHFLEFAQVHVHCVGDAKYLPLFL